MLLRELSVRLLTSYADNYSYDLRTQRSDVSLRGDELNAKLLEAAANGQLHRLRYLPRNADIDFADKDGLTALHHAVMSGSEDCVEEIIARGADVDATGIHGMPLNIAAQRQSLRIAALLFKAKAQQKPALTWVEENGQNIARFLLMARVVAGDATDLEALQLCVDESPWEDVQLGTREDVGVVREQHGTDDNVVNHNSGVPERRMAPSIISGVDRRVKMHKVQKSKHDEDEVWIGIPATVKG